MTIRKIEINGVNLVYLDQGRGTTVVFVHGAFSDHRVWEAQREVVAAHYRYIALTRRYHGTGPWPDNGESFSAATHAADLAAFIRALDAGPVHLVGRSYGGYIAILVALQHPDLVQSAVVQEPAIVSLLTGPEGKAILDERNHSAVQSRAAIAGGDLKKATILFAEWVNNKGPGSFNQEPEAYCAMALDNARTIPLQLTPAAPPVPITCEQLRQFKPPLLIVNGAQTRRFFSLVGEEVARCVAGSTRLVVANATHGPASQNPTVFNDALLKFLEKH